MVIVIENCTKNNNRCGICVKQSVSEVGAVITQLLPVEAFTSASRAHLRWRERLTVDGDR